MIIFLLIKYLRLKEAYRKLDDDVCASIIGCYSATINIPSGYYLNRIVKSKDNRSVTIEVAPNRLSFFEAEIKKMKECEEAQADKCKSIDEITVEDLQSMDETELKKLRHFKKAFDYKQRNMKKDDNADTPAF